MCCMTSASDRSLNIRRKEGWKVLRTVLIIFKPCSILCEFQNVSRWISLTLFLFASSFLVLIFITSVGIYFRTRWRWSEVRRESFNSHFYLFFFAPVILILKYNVVYIKCLWELHRVSSSNSHQKNAEYFKNFFAQEEKLSNLKHCHC